ncbi:hypothetical protein AAZX31_11G088400 [Glycine max]
MGASMGEGKVSFSKLANGVKKLTRGTHSHFVVEQSFLSFSLLMLIRSRHSHAHLPHKSSGGAWDPLLPLHSFHYYLLLYLSPTNTIYGIVVFYFIKHHIRLI